MRTRVAAALLSLAFCIAVHPATAWSEPKIKGAFGYALGAKFDMALAKKITRRFDGFMVCLVDVKKDAAPFTRIEIVVSPYSQIIVRIQAVAEYANIAEFTEQQLKILKQLTQEYGPLEKHHEKDERFRSEGRVVLCETGKMGEAYLLLLSYSDKELEKAIKDSDDNM